MFRQHRIELVIQTLVIWIGSIAQLPFVLDNSLLEEFAETLHIHEVRVVSQISNERVPAATKHEIIGGRNLSFPVWAFGVQAE